MQKYIGQLEVPEAMHSWDVPYPEYNPPYFTDQSVLTDGVRQGWADPEDIHSVDFSNRSSHLGAIRFDVDGYPLNPLGRMGIRGRGELGVWGPNHAADPIVIAPDEEGAAHVLLIQRGDQSPADPRSWALPGGMVNPGETLTRAALRELDEEASVDASAAPAVEVYKGVVRDPRMTDNAWIETRAVLLPLDSTVVASAGDDAVKADWRPVANITPESLYADHAELIIRAYQKARQLHFF